MESLIENKLSYDFWFVRVFLETSFPPSSLQWVKQDPEPEGNNLVSLFSIPHSLPFFVDQHFNYLSSSSKQPQIQVFAVTILQYHLLHMKKESFDRQTWNNQTTLQI